MTTTTEMTASIRIKAYRKDVRGSIMPQTRYYASVNGKELTRKDGRTREFTSRDAALKAATVTILSKEV